MIPARHRLPTHRRPVHAPLDWTDAWRLLLRLLWFALLAALLAGLVFGAAHLARDAFHQDTAPPPASAASGFSGLVEGYAGPPVVASVSGPRTRATSGWCEITVRDVSSSVTDSIDPSDQISQEVAAVAAALARGGLPEDRAGAVAFADTADASPVSRPDDTAYLQVLQTPAAALGGGTSISSGLVAAGDALMDCPTGSSVHVTIITDGETSEQDVTTGLDAIPADVPIDVVALDIGSWATYAPPWDRPNVSVTRITRLDAGTVATALTRIVATQTGQVTTSGFAPTEETP